MVCGGLVKPMGRSSSALLLIGPRSSCRAVICRAELRPACLYPSMLALTSSARI